MVSAGQQVMTPLLPAIANDFRATIATAGLLITAYSIPYGLFQIVYGPLADRFSRQRVIGIALSLFALGSIACSIAPTLPILTLFRVCTGAVAAGVIPVALAYVGDVVPYAERQATLGQVISTAALGGVLSSALGGIVASLLSWRALFLCYGLLALVVAMVLLRRTVPVRTDAPAPRRGGPLAPYRVLFAQTGARAAALYILVFFEGFAANGMAGYLGALLRERDGFSYAVIGGLLTVNGISSMLVARQAGWLVKRLSERGMLLAGGTLLTIAYLVAGLKPALIFFPLAMVLVGAGFVIAHSTLQTRATELAPAMRGTAVSFFAFSLFLGGGLGTFLIGQLIERMGYDSALLITAVLLGLFTIASQKLIRVVQRET